MFYLHILRSKDKVIQLGSPNTPPIIRPALGNVLDMVIFKREVPEVELRDVPREGLTPGQIITRLVKVLSFYLSKPPPKLSWSCPRIGIPSFSIN